MGTVRQITKLEPSMLPIKRFGDGDNGVSRLSLGSCNCEVQVRRLRQRHKPVQYQRPRTGCAEANESLKAFSRCLIGIAGLGAKPHSFSRKFRATSATA